MMSLGVFINCRCMDNIFLNRMNSRKGIVKKTPRWLMELNMQILSHKDDIEDMYIITAGYQQWRAGLIEMI